MLESIFLDFWKDNFTVHILCFISLLILCLEFEVIKRLLWPLNEQAAPFKNDKKQQKMAKTAKKYCSNIKLNCCFINFSLAFNLN